MALLRRLLTRPNTALPYLRATATVLSGIQRSRYLSYVPVDDLVNGLTEEQIQVRKVQEGVEGVAVSLNFII